MSKSAKKMVKIATKKYRNSDYRGMRLHEANCNRHGVHVCFGAEKEVYVPMDSRKRKKSNQAVVKFIVDENALAFDYPIPREVHIYDKAKKQRLEEYFAPILSYNKSGASEFYTQVKAVPCNILEYEAKHIKLRNKVDNTNKGVVGERNRQLIRNLGYYCFEETPESWLTYFVTKYGVDELARLGKFLDEYIVNDLNRWNVGFIGDKPVLIDFSGYESPSHYYHEEEDSSYDSYSSYSRGSY